MDHSKAGKLDGHTRRAALAGLGAAGAGAAAAQLLRPASARAAGVSNTYDIVVAADGSGDHTKIEAAVAAAPANSTIFVRNGTYTVESGPMRPRAGVRIVGEGYGAHIRAKDGLNSHLFVCGEPNVEFASLRVDGNGANNNFASGNCIYIDSVSHCRVIGCWVHSASGYNIVLFPGATHCVIADNHSYDSREEGIELQGASYCTVVGNVVEGNEINGILLWNSTGTCAYNTVAGNTVKDSGENGILVTDRARENTVTGNTVLRSAQEGIKVIDCGPNAVIGNVCGENNFAGIRVQKAPNCLVTGNTTTLNAFSGIYVNESSGCVVSGNESYRNNWSGIEIGSTATNNVEGTACTGNVCANNGRETASWRRSGIMLRGAVRGAVVADNVCYDDQSTKTQLYGLFVADEYPRDSVIGPNTYRGNATSGQFVHSGALPTMAAPAVRRLTVTVGTQQTRIEHGLGYTPLSMSITMTSAGAVYRSQRSDGSAIYLRADGNNRTAEVLVG